LVLALGSLTPATSSDFDISAAPTDISLAAGESASYTTSVAPAGGFRGTVTLSCSGAPAASTCSISPAQVTLDGNNPATATVTLTTVARSFLPRFAPRRFAPPMRVGKIPGSFFAYFLACVVLWRLACILRKRLLMMAAVVFPIALLCTSCGGSGSSPSPSITNPPPAVGTPQGAFKIVVTGTSTSLSHTANVMLRVN
jgi:hypothetical protein